MCFPHAGLRSRDSVAQTRQAVKQPDASRFAAILVACHAMASVWGSQAPGGCSGKEGRLYVEGPDRSHSAPSRRFLF
jgi:hypothetical protein